MEKFVIKNADGSEQNVIPAVHNSHKSARESILSNLFHLRQISISQISKRHRAS